MFRIAMSIYLAVMTLVGPWLCCCSVARGAVDRNGESPAASASSVADDGVPACCRHRHATQRKQPVGHRSHREGPCPCGKDPNRTAAAPDPESARLLRPAAATASPSDSPILLPFVLTRAADGVAAVARGPKIVSFWIAHDLLRTLHLLRC
jgi:hypothetical protein